MDPMAMYQMKYEKMEAAKNESERRLIHDAGNVAMNVIMSEYGAIKMLSKIFPSEN